MTTDQFNLPGRVDPLRVLLVDDSPLITDRLSDLLGAVDGIEVVGSSPNSEQAIADIERLAPYVIVLDIELENSNGWDVLQYVSQTHAEIQVFMFSNQVSQDTRALFLSGGATQFFDKSFDFELLLDALEGLLRKGH